MKKIFVYGAFVLALAACKNDKTTTKTDDKSTPSTTTGTSGTSTSPTTTPSDDNTTGTTMSGGWSQLEKSTFLKTCTDAAAGSMGRSKAENYCSCMGEKLEKMHPNASDASSMTQDDMKELAADCLK